MHAPSSFESLLQALNAGTKIISLRGPKGSAQAYLVSQLILQGLRRPFLYLGATPKDVAKFLADLRFFLGEIAETETVFLPPYDVLPFSRLSPHAQISCDRLKALRALSRKTPPAVIATTFTGTLGYLPPRSLFQQPLILRKDTSLDRDDFLKTLAAWGYQNSPLVSDRGQFAVRGSIVDVYSPLVDNPLRIEWMGDEIESLRFFDAKTQRSLSGIDSEFPLIPAREVVLTTETIATFSKRARKTAEDKDLTRSTWSTLVEQVRQGITFPGIETYLSLFYEDPTTFWDWIPAETIVLMEDPASEAGIREDYFSEIETVRGGKDFLLTTQESLATDHGEARERRTQVFLNAWTTPADEIFSFDVQTHDDLRHEIEKSKKGLEPLKPLANRLEEWLLTDAVFMIASSSAQAERLRDLLKHYRPDFPEIHIGEFSETVSVPGQLTLLVGDVTGFRMISPQRLTLITDQEIFGKETKRARNKDAGNGLTLSAFAEVKAGDPIVHRDHGIGLYRGLVPLQVLKEEGGVRNDFIIIEYQGGDKLYLPVYRLNLIQRYTGEGGAPRLDKMGGASWAKIREKSEKSIRELAGDLLNLYAARTSGHKEPFSAPNETFEAFEAAFPYEETPDQDRAIQEVLSDMQSDKPMDRLVLGDVGYGKTEVAMRAAFKAVLDGRQVAVLVPTTLLAFQHFERFSERFKNCGIPIQHRRCLEGEASAALPTEGATRAPVIDMLSRFRSAAEQKKTVQELAEGKIDVIVATHRLLQPDLSFKNLGLLIIDEEHRFGVEQKEKVKKLKKSVDVLALSATPIPRTLYMSLVGVRAISVIETPPNDRLSIRTFVMPFEDNVLKEAILREFHRGGQVFFVHNEVATIGKMKEFLQRLVPEAKIEIGHGQMPEDDLESVMVRFFHQEFNLLLCTTIIESGIDIPTANTIIIHQADHFGLSQIYQLRGRVGRSGHRAYAYLVVPEGKPLTPEATKRLEVLQRFSDLGSGYKMASHDLEIRGAGNMLGSSQSGHVAAIGYELYTELLTKAVAELKGQTYLEDIDPELLFRLPSYLSEEYIPDPPVRLELYRRLSALNDELETEIIAQELEDRFGTLPTEAQNLLELSAVKALAKRLRIKQIRDDGRQFTYAFDPSTPLSPDILTQKIERFPKRYKLTPDLRFTAVHDHTTPIAALKAVKTALREWSLHLKSA